jgi:DNA-binding transcriptional regulator LsrR (DeoR family)
MQPVLEKWKSLDAALISVGAPPEYYNSKLQVCSEEALREFESDLNRTVGDICARRFNINGEFLDNEYNHRIIGVEEADLRKTEKVICIAAGDHKVLSILGALRTDIIDILITDENTAKRVLEVHSMA